MAWKKVKLGNILTESKIISENPNPDRRITVRLKVLGVEKRGFENEVEGATKQYVRRAGQFIYGKQNFHKGAFGIVPPELDGFESSSDLPAFDVDESCLPEFIFYFFKQGNFYLELAKIASGVATQRINTTQLFELELLLPDIKTQGQLIENIRLLEKNGSAISTELTHQLTLVKKLRQQLLQDAVQGKLVEQNPKDEPASELLKKIKAEKEKLIAEKKLKKEKELPPIKPEEIPFDIPENWVWCRLGEICTKIGSGSTPKGSNYSSNGKPFFRSQNIYDSGLVYDDIKFISDEMHKLMNSTTVFAKDILLNITGGSMGRCALVPEGFEEGNVSQHVCIIRPLLVDNNFYHSIALSPFFQRFIFSSTTGAGREGLPKYNLEQFIIPLPPLSEQNRIVQKLEELMQYCNELEASIKQSELQNSTLLQQVLREALRKEPVGD
ncbi:MAG: restriction endonuclease subunit S [Bacteroidia bacterium]|nr:restriction endonuclease subunit S [Bacteroidia bacterium]